MQTRSKKPKKHGRYKVDTRPLCQGMPFVLTDAAHPRMILKNGSHFLVLDQSASIPACNTLGYGYYRYDTRHLSQWEMHLNGIPLSTLSTNVSEGYSGTFLHTNVHADGIPQQTLIVQRDVTLNDLLWEKISVENFLSACIDVELTFQFQSDFADMFEVRGIVNRPQRGERMFPVSTKDNSTLFLAYKGLDNNLLETIIEFHGMKPSKIEEGEVVFNLQLHGRTKHEFEISISTAENGKEITPNLHRIGFQEAHDSADTTYDDWNKQGTSIKTDDELFNASLECCLRDLFILRQPTSKGMGIAAGIPWYTTIFGRDSVITAWQMLPFLPDLAKDTVDILGQYQGTKEDKKGRTEEQVGRIMHELRFGELGRTKTIPFSPYYGTVDATQLWILLICEYVKWTGDLNFAHKFWPKLKNAVSWINKHSPEGYLIYGDIPSPEVENQGWKDSHDSVVFTDGRLGKRPIALCEAQAYVYAAKLELAELAEKLSHKNYASRLRMEAQELKGRFQKDFWMPEEQYLAAAIDGDGQQVDGLQSNPGHCLFTDILDESKAARVADRLMESDFWSGWGIRTLSSNNAAYNPISYHNGSIWPHDNSIIAKGFRNIGKVDYVHKIIKALYEVSQSQTEFRLPELFCGFSKAESDHPIDYPVSCSPQAWAAGSMFQLLDACINFKPDAINNRLVIVEPSLPHWLKEVVVNNVTVGEASVDLCFRASKTHTSCEILRKSGNIKVIIES